MKRLELTEGPFWDLGEGWRVHLTPDSPHFGRCWNLYTGERCGFTAWRLAHYPPTIEGWTELVKLALAATSQR
jgi:hypothetical protein